MCAMMECGHGPISLKERATEMKCDDFITFLENKQMNGVVSVLYEFKIQFDTEAS